MAIFSSWFFVSLKQFIWLQGEGVITDFKKENGYSVSFCSKCGSTVPNIFSTGDIYWVPAGAFESLGDAKVDNHIFVANKSRVGWKYVVKELNMMPSSLCIHENTSNLL